MSGELVADPFVVASAVEPCEAESSAEVPVDEADLLTDKPAIAKLLALE